MTEPQPKPFWKQTYFLFVLLQIPLVALLVIIGCVAKQSGWIPGN